MRISVIIPAFNEEKYLPKTLQSLKEQTGGELNYEIIVIDSQSTDRTSEVAQKYGARVLKLPKKTPAFARQKGVEAASGEIIACLDADTMVPSDYLSTISSEFAGNPKLVGITGIIDGWGGSFFYNLAYKWINSLFIQFSFLCGKPGFQGQSFAFRKSAFLKIGGFRTDIHTGEDLDLGYRMSKIGKIRFLPKTIGISSLRRTKEGLLKTIPRGLISYLKVVWRIPIGKKEKEPFPAVR